MSASNLKKYSFLIVCVFCSVRAFAQTPEQEKCIISPSVHNKVDSVLSGEGVAAVDLKVSINDTIVLDTFKAIKKIQTPAYTEKVGDTIKITYLFSPYDADSNIVWIGALVVRIIQDRAQMSLLVDCMDHSCLFKLNPSDWAVTGIDVPLLNKNVTLDHKPILKEGEILEGFVEFSEGKFYRYVRGKKEIKYRVELKGYFKSEPLELE